MRSSPRSRSKALFGLGRWGWALLAAGLAARLAYASVAMGRPGYETAADGYEFIAQNLLAGRGYSAIPGRSVPAASREPGFPLLIAAVYAAVGERPYALLAAQSALNVAACVALAGVALRLSGETAARLTLAIGLFYPYFVFYCGYFYRETLLTAAAAAGLYWSSRLLRQPRPADAALTGLAWGLCAATMSTFLLVSPLVGAVILWGLRRRKKEALMFSFALALLPGLWIARNFHVFKRFIPGSTLGGYNLYTTLIVPEDVRGLFREVEIERADPHWPRIMAMGELNADDGRQQEAFLRAAKDLIRADPGRYAAHGVKQALKLWRFYPYERQYQHSYALIKALSLLSDGWLIPLGVWGLCLCRRRGPEPALGLALIAAGTFAYALVAAIMRYRLPLMAPLLVGAGVVLSEKVVPLLTKRKSGFIKPA
jgi:4-amino-4-deoxy-L-arabinose transferase-like glycosyltransferase